MSGQRPTLRHGLPHRWWRRPRVRRALRDVVLALVCAVALVGMPSLLLYLWFLR